VDSGQGCQWRFPDVVVVVVGGGGGGGGGRGLMCGSRQYCGFPKINLVRPLLETCYKLVIGLSKSCKRLGIHL
jgi:hypothetical protein